MDCVVHSKEPLVLVRNMDSYFLSTAPDCSLFSQDNYEIQIHKELLYQTKYLREMIKNVGIDSKIDMICELTKEELETVVEFLYRLSHIITHLLTFYNQNGQLLEARNFTFVIANTINKIRILSESGVDITVTQPVESNLCQK